jgi:hypothetical protein
MDESAEERNFHHKNREDTKVGNVWVWGPTGMRRTKYLKLLGVPWRAFARGLNPLDLAWRAILWRVRVQETEDTE